MIATPLRAPQMMATARCAVPAGALLPLRSARMVCRFKDDKKEEFREDPRELQERRRAEEEVIRRQEELLKERITGSQRQEGQPIIQSPTAQEMAKKDPFPNGYKISPLAIGFTRRREILAGRIAMVGFFATCFAEWFFPSHPNAILQVAGYGQLLGLPVDPSQVALVLGGIVIHNFIAGLAPGSPTWAPENQADVAKRPQGPPLTMVSPLDWKRFFGVTEWGFTKENELFHGRLAMLGFAGSLIQTLRLGGWFGPGPLAQLAALLGTQTDDSFWGAVPGVFFGWLVFATVLAGLNGRMGQQQQNKNIY